MSTADVLDLVSRIRRGAFSRNRNYGEFEDSRGAAARAQRLSRFLRSLERDLGDVAAEGNPAAQLWVEPGERGGRRLVIEVPTLRLRRVAVLSAEEYDLLREHPEARAALDRAEGRAES